MVIETDTITNEIIACDCFDKPIYETEYKSHLICESLDKIIGATDEHYLLTNNVNNRISIRAYGHTIGYIYTDNNHKIIDIVMTNQTAVQYPIDIVKQLRQFIGTSINY